MQRNNHNKVGIIYFTIAQKNFHIVGENICNCVQHKLTILISIQYV